MIVCSDVSTFWISKSRALSAFRLAGMSRASDDSSEEAGELNDSLLDYLNDAIRQQEKKVEQMVDVSKKVEELERFAAMKEDGGTDELEKLWKVDEEDGMTVESFDPRDPKSKQALEAEYKKLEEEVADAQQIPLPIMASQKLLLLLKMLRERVKIEAAFSNDEKAKNLRVLAYCLKLHTDGLRRELITKELGNSLDVSARKWLVYLVRMSNHLVSLTSFFTIRSDWILS
jgi:hypothetical protein